jgi:hypothetical protein
MGNVCATFYHYVYPSGLYYLTLTYIMAVFLFYYFKEKKIDISYVVQGSILLVMYLAIIKFYHYPGWKDVL